MGGAFLLMACSATCISLLETRRVRGRRRQRSLQQATENWEGEGGAILSDGARVTVPVL